MSSEQIILQGMINLIPNEYLEIICEIIKIQINKYLAEEGMNNLQAIPEVITRNKTKYVHLYILDIREGISLKLEQCSFSVQDIVSKALNIL